MLNLCYDHATFFYPFTHEEASLIQLLHELILVMLGIVIGNRSIFFSQRVLFDRLGYASTAAWLSRISWVKPYIELKWFPRFSLLVLPPI